VPEKTKRPGGIKRNRALKRIKTTIPESVLMERDESAFRGQAKGIAGMLREKNAIAVVHHYDADGMAAAGIIGKALQRAGKEVKFLAVKQLYSETFQEIKGLGAFYLFADFGSSYIPELKEAFGLEFAVIDHHQPKALAREKFHFNPMLYGIDGGNEISGAGLCYLVARELGENADLAALAVVGAVGDMQDSGGKLIGLNAEIAEDGVKAGVLKRKEDMRLYGRITRPLPQFLEFASGPVIPGLTADREACFALLEKLHIKLKENGKWRSYSKLEEDEMKGLATALVLRMQEAGLPEWKQQSLFGEVFTMVKEDPESPLRDAKEFATLLNATGRHGMAEIGREVCLGDREEYYKNALNLLLEHRRQLRQGIELMQAEGVKERDSFHYFDAGDKIQDSLVGIVAGMLYGSGFISPKKPVIALARHEDGSVKVSARGTRELVRKGLNLGKALKECCAELGEKSEGGGHSVAAGCRITEEEREKFLEALGKKIKDQLSAKQG